MPAVSKAPITDTSDLIQHIKPLIERFLSSDVSNVYFGDVGVYLPSHFTGPRKENKAVVVLQPAFDNVDENLRFAHQEFREIGIDVVGLINVVPYFKANPDEAFGEKQLALIMKKLRTLLTQQALSNLEGRVNFFRIGDITWSWLQRDTLSLRGAALRVTARIKVDRTQDIL